MTFEQRRTESQARQSSVAPEPYDDEYTAAVQVAARAIHASDVQHLSTLDPADGLPRDGWTLAENYNDLSDADRLFYIRAAGAALTCVWNRGWRLR